MSALLLGAAAFGSAAGLGLLRWASSYPYSDISRGFAQLFGAAGVVAGAVGLGLAVWLSSPRSRRSAAGWLVAAGLFVGAALAGWSSAQWVTRGLDGAGSADDGAVADRPAGPAPAPPAVPPEEGPGR